MPTHSTRFTTNSPSALLTKQLRLADAHGEDAWGFNMTKGEITFNESVAYKVQILGTRITSINRGCGVGATRRATSRGLLSVANDLRAYGDKHTITQFTTAKLPLGTLDGHTAGLIACGFAQGKAYYRCRMRIGALFVLITDPKLNLSVDDPIIRATRVIPNVSQRWKSQIIARQLPLTFGGKVL